MTCTLLGMSRKLTAYTRAAVEQASCKHDLVATIRVCTGWAGVMILKGEFAQPASWTSYQVYGCHLKKIQLPKHA